MLRTSWHLDNRWDVFEAAICDLAMFCCVYRRNLYMQTDNNLSRFYWTQGITVNGVRLTIIVRGYCLTAHCSLLIILCSLLTALFSQLTGQCCPALACLPGLAAIQNKSVSLYCINNCIAITNQSTVKGPCRKWQVFLLQICSVIWTIAFSHSTLYSQQSLFYRVQSTI